MRVAGLCAVAVLALGAQGSTAASPRVLVGFEQRGGFAGIERSLVVQRSGRVVSDGLAVNTRTLAPARLAALRKVLAGTRFATLARHYESDAPVADGYVYRITYGGRMVQIEEGATLPARLQRLFALLTGLIER